VSTSEAIRSRRSIRSFTERDVEQADLDALLEAASWAPSPHNSQPWRFVVVRPGPSRTRLADAMAAQWLSDLDALGETTTSRRAKVEGRRARTVRAPVAIVACLRTDSLDRYPDERRWRAEVATGEQSLGAAVQNLLLEAEARRLGCNWICAPTFCPDVVAEALALDETLAPRVLILAGWPANRPAPKPRLGWQELTLWR
jgi:F420 biosynthesis protein FbiB-like protein